MHTVLFKTEGRHNNFLEKCEIKSWERRIKKKRLNTENDFPSPFEKTNAVSANCLNGTDKYGDIM
jgi:hypothetical protein